MKLPATDTGRSGETSGLDPGGNWTRHPCFNTTFPGRRHDRGNNSPTEAIVLPDKVKPLPLSLEPVTEPFEVAGGKIPSLLIYMYG